MHSFEILKMEKLNFQEYYEKLEFVLSKALEGLQIHENDSISNEVNAACKNINENYLFELKSMICLMFNEIKKISNHYIQTINWFYQQQEDTRFEGLGDLNIQNEDLSELTKFLSKTTELIEKSTLLLEMKEIKETNTELIQSINELLEVTKYGHITELNDLTVFISDNIVN